MDCGHLCSWLFIMLKRYGTRMPIYIYATWVLSDASTRTNLPPGSAVWDSSETRNSLENREQFLKQIDIYFVQHKGNINHEQNQKKNIFIEPLQLSHKIAIFQFLFFLLIDDNYANRLLNVTPGLFVFITRHKLAESNLNLLKKSGNVQQSVKFYLPDRYKHKL